MSEHTQTAAAVDATLLSPVRAAPVLLISSEGIVTQQPTPLAHSQSDAGNDAAAGADATAAGAAGSMGAGGLGVIHARLLVEQKRVNEEKKGRVASQLQQQYELIQREAAKLQIIKQEFGKIDQNIARNSKQHTAHIH